ncbi:MAG: glycoside hydrolase family 15 protein [Candidatus Paceibacterota bacterium]
MSRSLVLGNGTILVCMDAAGRIRDFYYPYVGHENHIASGNALSVGVWVNGTLSWIGDEGWQIRVDYEDETLASNIDAYHKQLQIRLHFRDVVYNEENVLIRHVSVENLARKRDVRVFFNQQFTISETSHADTAYYNPNEKAIIHYKGRRVFLVGGRSGGEAFQDYTVGLFGIDGKEGTYRDAEDGELAKNPIEHGPVDSTLGFHLNLRKNQTAEVTYWVAVGETYKETKDLHEMIARKTATHILKSGPDFWNAWVNKSNFTFSGLSSEVVSLFKKSLLILRTHCDERGGILASGDGASGMYGKDTYGYIWPRDGAFIALALGRAGYTDVAHRFIEFTHNVLTEEGYILHKYQPDRSLGSSWHPWVQEGVEQLAIQEDETALLLYVFWEQYKLTKNLEYIEEVYNSYIKRMADFLVSYRDEVTGLPKPSYDLWEEKNGVSTFTCASVYGALYAACQFATLLGKEDDAELYHKSAKEVRHGILTYLYDEKDGYFVKLLNTKNGTIEYDRTIDASSFYGMFQFGVLPPDDERLLRAAKLTHEALSGPLPSGGVARYSGDKYFTVDPDLPGNPWFVTTLWFTQYAIKRAKRVEDLKGINEDLGWVAQHALASGVLSEQLDPHTGNQVSIAPLAWSHAEYVRTVIEYMQKLEELGGPEATKSIEYSLDLDENSD